MTKDDLTKYDIKPKAMINYFRYYGYHFNKDLCDFAVSRMKKEVNGELRKIKPYEKEDVDRILKENNVKLKNEDSLYDYVYIANMCKADFLGSSIADEKHLALYIKDVIDDVDAYDGIILTRWYADCCKNGIPIDWEQIL